MNVNSSHPRRQPLQSLSHSRSRSRSRARSAVVDLVPYHDDDENEDESRKHLDDDDDDDDIVCPSPTPPVAPQQHSPTTSPGRLLAQFYLDHNHLLGNDDDLIPPSASTSASPSASFPHDTNANDSLLDFPPTPSTAHASSFLSPAALSRSLSNNNNDDDDPFGFAAVERRMQLTRPFAAASSQGSFFSAPPPSQRPPTSLVSSPPPSSTLTTAGAFNNALSQPDPASPSLLLSHRPLSPLSSLHLTRPTQETQDPLDPTLYPPQLEEDPERDDLAPTQRVASLSASPLPQSSPPMQSKEDDKPSPSSQLACKPQDSSDDDFFTFKPTSRAAQTHARVSSAMHAALHAGAATSAAKKQPARRRTVPVARTVKMQHQPLVSDKLSAAETHESKITVKKKKTTPATRSRKAQPVQVTRFLGELIGVPTSSPSPPASPSASGTSRRTNGAQRTGPSSDSEVDARPVRSTPMAPKAKNPRSATASKKTATKPAHGGGVENTDPFALPLDPSPQPTTTTKRRPTRPVAKKPVTSAAPRAKTKRTSAERVAAAEQDVPGHAEQGEAGSPHKRARTVKAASTTKRVTRARRAAAQVEE